MLSGLALKNCILLFIKSIQTVSHLNLSLPFWQFCLLESGPSLPFRLISSLLTISFNAGSGVEFFIVKIKRGLARFDA